VADSSQFIRYIESTPFPHDVKLVTIDVTSLYTNIPQDEGMRFCIDAFDRHYADPVLSAVCEYYLYHFLKNVFYFTGRMYR
jgi:hypothetical protein